LFCRPATLIFFTQYQVQRSYSCCCLRRHVSYQRWVRV